MTISYSDDFLSLLKRWKGSVWKAVWKEAAAFLFLYYTIRIILTFYLNQEQYTTASKVVKLFDSFTTKLPLQFLLGFYVGQVVNRWWAQVLAVPWPDEIMVWTNAIFNKDDIWSRLRRRMIARYLILCETLVLRNVSTRIRKRFPTMQTLVKSELMTEVESDCYHKVRVENNRWQLPLQWIIHGIIIPAVKSDEIMSSSANTLIGKINDFRNALRAIYIYDWVCIPLVYTQTCSVVVYGYFGLCLIGHQYVGTEADLYVPWLTVLQFIFFVGWFKVAQDLMRPFGEDDDDIELNVLLDRHIAVAMNYADQLCDILPPMPEKPPDTDAPNLSMDDTSPNDDILEVTDATGNGVISNSDAISKSDLISKKSSVIIQPEIILPPALSRLPYTRASLRSPKDHGPKLLAHVRIKKPEEEEFIHVGLTKKATTDKTGLEAEMFKLTHAIESWQTMIAAPYDKRKPNRYPNHF